MENKEMFEMLLNKIEELTKENTSLKLRIKCYKKYEELKDKENKAVTEEDLDEIFNPENYRFQQRKVGAKHEIMHKK